MLVLLCSILLGPASARPLDTVDATTVGARTVQLEAGVDVGPEDTPVPTLAAGLGLSQRLDLTVGAALDDIAVGGKWLLRPGSPQGGGGPSVAVEAGASPVAREAGVVLAATQQWTALSVHVATDVAVAADGNAAAGAGLGLELLPNAAVRPAAEVRLDGDAPSGLLAVVVSPHPAWMLDVAVLGGPDAAPMVRAGVTWAIAATRDLSPAVATSELVELDEPRDGSLPEWAVALRSQNQ